MPKLTLKFEDRVIKEVAVGTQAVIIGRSPDTDIQIDNLAVSTNHAKVFVEEGRLVVEDMNSLNGTFVNNQRVQRTILKTGDSILIGKHHLVVDDSWDAGGAPVPEVKKVIAPKVQETMVLDSKKRMEMLQQAAAQAGVKIPGQPAAPAAASSGAPAATGPAAATVPAAPPARARVASLIVMGGSTDQREYLLSGKLTIIGKSEMATVKITGFNWFKPKMAAQINKRDDGYYVARADKTPTVNGLPIQAATKLNDGDMIEVAGLKLSFQFKD